MEFRMFNVLFIMFLNVPMCRFQQPVFKAKTSSSLVRFDRKISAASEIQCCAQCERDSSCSSTGYRRSTKECFISYTPTIEALVNATDASSTVFARDGWNQEWLIVFRGIPGIGLNPVDALLNGAGSTSDLTCRDIRVPSCDKHYRDPLVHNWTALRLTEVKIVFYKGNLEKFIKFNGTGSSVSNWFDINRVLASSWPTLVSGPYGYFSIDGDAVNGRRFFTAGYYEYCMTDRIFTLVITEKVAPCAYDRQSSYPQILFATGDDRGYPESMTGMALADSFAIFIK